MAWFSDREAILLTYILKYVPWIHKFVMATIGCGISHKNTKHTDKCSNNKTKTTQKPNDGTIDKYFSKIQ
jgi:hypothetical protein